MKKYTLKFTATLVGLFGIVIAGTAYAATPTLSMVSNGNGDSIQVTVVGDSGSSVLLSYIKTNVGPSLSYLGNTDGTGSLSTIISTATYGATAGSSVYVTVNGKQSLAMAWPATSGSGVFSLSQTGVTLSVGQTSSITANNSSGSVYLSSNSNPPIANVNVSGNQISITALSSGSTVISICSGNSTTCASAYVTVGNSAAQALTFSISNVTVAPGQSVPIAISGGTGSYTLLNNSNSSVIQAGINGSTVTLTTSATTGTAAITICSTDMSACGIINATAGTTSSSAVVFNPLNPRLSVGTSAVVTISGGMPSGVSSTNYYLSSNSNSSIVQTSISGSSLTLTGLANGNSTITICSSAGSCASLTVTVNFTSSGGSLQLSQTTMAILVGQVLTVTVSGGDSPYSLTGGTGAVAQTSLNGNIISISGLSVGTSNVNVCSAGGACLQLSIIVNASGAGTQLTFNPNNLNLVVGGSNSITITGNGGYYASNSTNPAVASVQITGSTAVVTGLAAGSNNISICQSGGQCALVFVTVTGSSSGLSLVTFSASNPTVQVGQVLNVTVSGGAGSSYYVLTNTNSSVVQSSLNSNILALTGLTNGSSTVVVCATASSCGSLAVTVGAASTSPLSLPTPSLPTATTGQAYATQVSATGGSGSYDYSINSGSLPDGLTLSALGVISGTPTVSGNFSFNVKATDKTNSSIWAAANTTLSVVAGTPTTTTPPPSSGTYNNGQLINENGTIYIVYQDTKVAFTNAEAFLGLGFSFKNTLSVTDSGLAVSPKTVVTAQGSHPRGTWVLSGSTVYFVTPAGLIPVSSWDNFIGNGGQASYIVKINSYDLAMPKLSVLTPNDARLHP